MFFGRRRRWNGEVVSLLPVFNLTPEILGGPLAIIDSLDLVYKKGYSHQEGALFLAYNVYVSFLKTGDHRAADLAHRMQAAEENWLKIGRVTPANVSAWRAYAERITNEL